MSPCAKLSNFTRRRFILLFNLVCLFMLLCHWRSSYWERLRCASFTSAQARKNVEKIELLFVMPSTRVVINDIQKCSLFSCIFTPTWGPLLLIRILHSFANSEIHVDANHQARMIKYWFWNGFTTIYASFEISVESFWSSLNR